LHQCGVCRADTRREGKMRQACLLSSTRLRQSVGCLVSIKGRLVHNQRVRSPFSAGDDRPSKSGINVRHYSSDNGLSSVDDSRRGRAALTCRRSELANPAFPGRCCSGGRQDHLLPTQSPPEVSWAIYLLRQSCERASSPATQDSFVLTNVSQDPIRRDHAPEAPAKMDLRHAREIRCEMPPPRARAFRSKANILVW
jgi:hypothetical protein